MYANIVVHNPSDSTMIKGGVAEEDGSFLVASLPFGNYFISISYIGFAPYQSEVLGLEDESNRVK